MVIFTAKTSWTYSVLVEIKFGLFQSWVYEMRCPFVAVELKACFIVLPHWDNMSVAHMITHIYNCEQYKIYEPVGNIQNLSEIEDLYT